MRVDLVLKYLCLARSRSLAKHLCDDGRVTINGVATRASSRVTTNDRLHIRFDRSQLDIELLRVPNRQLSKAVAPEFYRVIANKSLEPGRDIVDGI